MAHLAGGSPGGLRGGGGLTGFAIAPGRKYAAPRHLLPFRRRARLPGEGGHQKSVPDQPSKSSAKGKGRGAGGLVVGTEEQSDLLVRLSASSSVTWPPKTTFLIASDGCAQGKAIKRGELTGQSGAARLGAEARGGREGALPGRGGAAATALRGRWLGPGAAATRAGRPWRCGSSSPAPPSPSPPRRRPALLPLSLSRRFVCSLSL